MIEYARIYTLYTSAFKSLKCLIGWQTQRYCFPSSHGKPWREQTVKPFASVGIFNEITKTFTELSRTRRYCKVLTEELSQVVPNSISNT